jgi:hypothetical protein
MGVFPVGLEHERGDGMSREALKLALKALETCEVAWPGTRFKSKYFAEDEVNAAITAIKQALAAPDLQAELEATNRQVEILSDALAESRREVAALKAVQEPVATLFGSLPVYDTPPVQEPVNKEQA